MDLDDIVVGSGLTAFATVLGLNARRKILVLAGPRLGTVHYYDETKSVPRSFTGFGGLGNYWHGVISTAQNTPYSQTCTEDFSRLFRRFYPGAGEFGSRFGHPWLFIPRKPLRPAQLWPGLIAERQGNLRMLFVDADRFAVGDGSIEVVADGQRYRAGRLWIAAGALGTPVFLEASLGRSVARSTVSDHVVCYAGQIDRSVHPDIKKPEVLRSQDGYWLKVRFGESGDALFITKPARFGFKRLDFGIEQRAAFGLPTSSAVAKIMRSQSPGLLAEALFNRYGVFPDSKMLSVYAQVAVEDAYDVTNPGGHLTLSGRNVLAAIDAAKAPWPQMTESRRRDLFIKGIHLHHSVDLPALAASGLTRDASRVRIVDPSVLSEIGPEHHSFYTMARAAKAAREASE